MERRRQPTLSTKAKRRKFKGDNPRSYPKLNWDRYDELVKSATRLHIGVYFDVTGPGPSQFMGHTKDRSIAAAYKPNAKEFSKFVRAVGTRYSGTYRDENYGRTILPAVHFWSLWNEPNQGAWLAPQYLHGKPNSPKLYRELYLRGHQALAETGHGRDVILAGETAPLGSPAKGARSPMRPAKFIRELFCLQMRALGVDVVRVTVLWRNVANGALDTPARRAHFNGANPHSYPAANWDRYDELVKSATRLHMMVYETRPPLKGTPLVGSREIPVSY